MFFFPKINYRKVKWSSKSGSQIMQDIQGQTYEFERYDDIKEVGQIVAQKW